jgi:ribulose 1,5-bisphosphate synthetase/thiazole synthase
MFLPNLLFVSIILFFHCSSTIAYDIIVYTGTPGGIAAAITAARASPSLSIAIIEPTSYVGGMSTGGGLGLRDLGLAETSEYIIEFFVSSTDLL